MNPEFWRGKNVFLTGHTGFKGSWLALWLSRVGANVLGYALPPPTVPSLFAQARVGSQVDSKIGSVEADIRDSAKLSSEMRNFEPDVVLHLAARSVVLDSYDDPIETFSTNVVGTASVLQAARALTKRVAIVNVTTDKVYENQRWYWGYRETDMLGGRDPYSSSKACAEFVARAFRESYFSGSASGSASTVALASARAGNVIGGGDYTPHQLIPDCVTAFGKGQAVVLRHPRAIRPWQHVLDCLDGYLTLAQALYAGDRYDNEWNFGPAESDMRTVADVVQLLAKPWNVDPAWTQDPGTYSHEEMDLRLNSQKAARELGWSCQLPLATTLAWTGEWFQRQQRGEDARALCLEQIERYQNLRGPAA